MYKQNCTSDLVAVLKDWLINKRLTANNIPSTVGIKASLVIRSAVLLVHGEKAHSCYFSKDAYADMIKDSKYADNKELMIIPDAVHTDLYDGGDKDYIPFDKLENFFKENLK